MIEKLRTANLYSGTNKFQHPLEISVTEITAGDPWQMYLRRKFDAKPEPKVTHSTLGSIFDLGMRQMSEELGLKSGGRVKKKFGKYIITGEFDLVDEEQKIIYDVKLTKVYALMQFQKEPLEHGYTQQLNMYRYLFDMEDYKGVIAWFLKDQSDLKKGDPKETLVLTEVPSLPKIVLTKKLEHYIEKMESYQKDEQAGQCEDRWANDIRCKNYCDSKSVCPYAKRRGYNGSTLDW